MLGGVLPLLSRRYLGTSEPFEWLVYIVLTQDFRFCNIKSKIFFLYSIKERQLRGRLLENRTGPTRPICPTGPTCPTGQKNAIRLSAGFLIASADSLILSADILIVFLSSSKGVILLIRPKMLHRLVSTRRRRMKTYGLVPLECMKRVAICGRHSSSRTTNEKNHYLCCVQHPI